MKAEALLLCHIIMSIMKAVLSHLKHTSLLHSVQPIDSSKLLWRVPGRPDPDVITDRKLKPLLIVLPFGSKGLSIAPEQTKGQDAIHLAASDCL